MRRLRPSKYAECDDESSDLALRKRSKIFPLKSDDSNSNGTPNGIGLSLLVLLLTLVSFPALTNTGACTHFSGCRSGKVECDRLQLNDVMMYVVCLIKSCRLCLLAMADIKEIGVAKPSLSLSLSLEAPHMLLKTAVEYEVGTS